MAKDSHEISSLIFSENQRKKFQGLSPAIVNGALLRAENLVPMDNSW